MTRFWRAALAVLVCATSLHSVRAQAVDDEEFPASELITGKSMSREQCNATRDAVWVEHREGTECIRYFPSSNVAGAKVAALFFHGDRLEGRFVITSAYRNNHASALRALAEEEARANGVPYIFVARPGVYGSSGKHYERRRLKEYLSLNAAVDAIKARYGLERVHLGGQSGGATAVGALLTLGRTDIVCAAASSGGYDTLARAKDIALQRGSRVSGCDSTGYCDAYNVVDHVAGVQRSEQRRLFIVGDPNDSNTLFKYQQAFAEKLTAAGHHAVLAEGQGQGSKRHSLSHMANRTLGWCNAGQRDEQIAEQVRASAPALRTAKQKSAKEEE